MTDTAIPEHLRRAFPWGRLFAMRKNFEAGYLQLEGELVDAYLERPSDVLVIGSGNGREARPICGQGHRIVCQDLAFCYIQSGQKLFSELGAKNVRFIQNDVTEGLAFTDNSFDFVFFSLYSSCGRHRFEVMRDIHRVTRPGGLVLHNAATPYYRTAQPRADIKGWVLFDTIDSLQREVTGCGFRLLQSGVDKKRREYRVSMLKAE